MISILIPTFWLNSTCWCLFRTFIYSNSHSSVLVQLLEHWINTKFKVVILLIWTYAVPHHTGVFERLALRSESCVWMLYYRIRWASLFWLGAVGHLHQSFHWFLNREGAEAKPHALPLGTVSNHLPEAQHCSALSAFHQRPVILLSLFPLADLWTTAVSITQLAASAKPILREFKEC